MKKIKRLIALMSLLVVLAAAAGGGWVYSMYQTPTQNLSDQIIEIPRGASFRAVTHLLQNEDVYPHPEFLYYWARITDQTQVRHGEYRVPESLTVPELLTLLTSGQTVQHRITFVEGWRFDQWRTALASLDNIEHTLADMSDEEVAEALGLDYEIPEGLLYPNTYSYQRGATDLSILRQARNRLTNVLEREWEQRSERSVMESPYEALILASIIERETGAPWEREDIAGVFTRRLEMGMRLQTDPTVIYGLGDAYEGVIRRSHLDNWTPYNTYRIDGLPPTPIAMAGTDSIRAALNPAEGDALYFVARGDGTHQFSATLSEHNAAVRRYQLQRAQDYRSSPPPLPVGEGANEHVPEGPSDE